MTHRSRPMRRAALLAASAALTATALTGCGDSGEGPEADPSSGLSLDTSEDANTDLPEGVPTEKPAEPTESKHDSAGAKAFTEHVFRTYQFSVATRDLDPLLELGSCPSCDFARKAIRNMKQEGYFEVPDERLKVHHVEELYRQGEQIAMGVSYSLPPGKKVSESGEVLEKLDASEKKFMEVGIVWKGDSWRLFDLTIAE